MPFLVSRGYSDHANRACSPATLPLQPLSQRSPQDFLDRMRFSCQNWQGERTLPLSHRNREVNDGLCRSPRRCDALFSSSTETSRGVSRSLVPAMPRR